MRSIADPAVRAALAARLRALAPDSPRRWGTLTAHEVLCHLGDSTANVLSRPGGPLLPRRPLFKWFALRSPLPWPRGLTTFPGLNPRTDGTRPSDFERDRERALAGLEAVAAAAPDALPSGNRRFGRMTAEDWGFWAFRHTDHHLRQFGL